MALPIHDDAPTRRIPWMTYTLIVVNVIVFLFLEPASLQGGDVDRDEVNVTEEREINEYAYKWGAIPCEIQHMEPLSEGIRCTGERDASEPAVSGKVVLLSLLTCMFIHGSIFHLAGNMLFLWVFGNNVEDRLGPVPYLALYLLTGLVATFGHALFNWDDAVPVLGASGAIAGVMGAYLVFRPRGRILTRAALGRALHPRLGPPRALLRHPVPHAERGLGRLDRPRGRHGRRLPRRPRPRPLLPRPLEAGRTTRNRRAGPRIARLGAPTSVRG